jgi:hypothetical protein
VPSVVAEDVPAAPPADAVVPAPPVDTELVAVVDSLEPPVVLVVGVPPESLVDVSLPDAV